MFLKVELLKGMIFVKNESLKKKVLCSVLAASVFGVMYAGDVQAASINGKTDFVKNEDGSITITDKVLGEAGSKKFIFGQGDKIIVATDGSVGGLLNDLAAAGKDFDKIRVALAKNSVMGVVGGEGQLDKGFLQILNDAKQSNGGPIEDDGLKKLENIDTINSTDLDVEKNGDTYVVIGGLDENGKATSPVVIGAIGGDLSVNAGLDGKIDVNIAGTYPVFNSQFKNEGPLSINRNGNTNMLITGGNVFGVTGGSAALSVGNIEAKFNSKSLLNLDAEISFNGNTTTTINGSVNTLIGSSIDSEGNLKAGTANVGGLFNGGLAMAVGGSSVSNVTGDSNLIINSEVNIGKEGKIDGITAGVTGGGVAMTTFGGTATSDVQGDANISINNGLTGFVAGGGIAAAVEATGVAEQVYKPDGKELQLGNNKGFVDITDKQLEALLGKESGIPEGTITINNAIQGGTATSKIGNTNITLTGTTTAAGILGGGIAVSSHTYTVKDGSIDYPVEGYKTDDAYGKSVATAESGKTTITLNLDSSNLDKGKLVQAVTDLKGALSNVKDIGEFKALEECLNAFAQAEDQGAALGVFGGGMAIAHGGNGDLVNDKKESAGAFSTATNKGAEINLGKGYFVGTFGGGVAGALNNATAKAETTEDIVINVYKDAEAIGVAGNGIAYYTGSSNGGKNNLTGTATVTAKNTAINLAGKADGVIGGGIAIDGSQADKTNAIVKSEKSTITVYDGAEVSKLNFDPLERLAGKAPESGIDMGSYVAAVKAAAENIAIAGGGVAIGGGAVSTVEESVINVAGGTVKGDIVAGGVAVYGYGDNNGGSTVEKSTINLNAGKVEGNVFAGGSASAITTGSAGYDKAKATVGESTINLNGAEVTGFISGLGVSGKDNDKATTSILNVTGNNILTALADKSKISGFNQVNFAADSVTTITDLKAGNSFALIDGNGNKINVNEGAKLDISNLDKVSDKDYFIADNYADGSRLWNDAELAYDRTEGFATVVEDKVNKDYKVTYKALEKLSEKEQDAAADSMEKRLGRFGGQVRGIIDGIIRDGKHTSAGADEFFKDLTSGTGDASADLRTGMLFGEAAGVTSNSISMATDFADNAALRLSFTQDKVTGENKVAEEGGVWAKYLHNKHEVNGADSSMGGLTSSNDYDGVMVGAELAKKGDYQYGIAFSYGDGDGSGMGVENDFDTWGVNVYSNLKKDDVNIIADLGYSKTSNELTGNVADGTMKADRDVNVLTAGVRAEKLYVDGNTQVVPYIGLRYFNIDGDSYTSYYNGKAAFQNEADSQNVWTLPIGVSLRNETVTKSGWRVTPKVDLAYIFAFGDTDNTVTVNSGSGMSTLSYDVMDSSSWLASAALEAGKGDWSYGIGYSYQKGSDVENNKWFVNVNYSF